jgi:hypothetical protein
MGGIYKASDSRRDRFVASKLLPESMFADAGSPMPVEKRVRS